VEAEDSVLGVADVLFRDDADAGGDAIAIDDDLLAAASDVGVFLDIVGDDAAHVVLDRINITWEGESGARGHETEVMVTFEATPGGTRLVLLQQRFENKQARDSHNVGWSSSFDRLAKISG
jgi:Activator of Hsp90 ATPase homolog 1-like protein